MKIINPFNKRNVHGLWLLVTSNSNRRSVVTVSLISLSWVFTIERKHLQQCLTSWCRVVCHCQLAAGACWELSCCEPQISCRCGRTCPESRSILLASRLLSGKTCMGPSNLSLSSLQLWRKNTSMVYSWGTQKRRLYLFVLYNKKYS